MVDAFFAATRAGDLAALIAVLHPDVVLRADFGPSQPRRSTLVRGAEAVASQARLSANAAAELHPALVNGSAGAVITLRGRPVALLAFTVSGDKIVEIDAIGDPERVRTLSAGILGPLT